MHIEDADYYSPGLLQPIALSVLAFGLGYQVHSYTSRRTLSSTASASIPKPTRSRSSSTSSNESHIEAEDSDSEAEDEKAALISDLTSVKATMLDEIKLVLVVNDSLKMSKGKIAAQAGHATLACAFMLNEIHPRVSRDPHP
jgi:PTH2 family peptidyl-tRNA hydrolase